MLIGLKIATQVAQNKRTLLASFPIVCYAKQTMHSPWCRKPGGGGGALDFHVDGGGGGGGAAGGRKPDPVAMRGAQKHTPVTIYLTKNIHMHTLSQYFTVADAQIATLS